MLILEAHVVVGGTVFLQGHGPLVCTCFCRVVGQVSVSCVCIISLRFTCNETLWHATGLARSLRYSSCFSFKRNRTS